MLVEGEQGFSGPPEGQLAAPVAPHAGPVAQLRVPEPAGHGLVAVADEVLGAVGPAEGWGAGVVGMEGKELGNGEEERRCWRADMRNGDNSEDS